MTILFSHTSINSNIVCQCQAPLLHFDRQAEEELLYFATQKQLHLVIVQQKIEFAGAGSSIWRDAKGKHVLSTFDERCSDQMAPWNWHRILQNPTAHFDVVDIEYSAQ